MKVAYIDGPEAAPDNVTADRYLNGDYFTRVTACKEVILCGDLPEIEKAYSKVEGVKIKKVESRRQKREKAKADAEAKLAAEDEARAKAERKAAEGEKGEVK